MKEERVTKRDLETQGQGQGQGEREMEDFD
jgi:hypothetical protein